MTAEDVVLNIICSLPFSSAIKCASSISILWLLVSRLPPNCGDVSATTSVIPPRAEDIDASVVFFSDPASASCISIVSLDVSRDVSAVYPVITFAFIIAVSTAPLAIVTAPFDAMVTSPDTATGLKLAPSATMM